MSAQASTDNKFEGNGCLPSLKSHATVPVGQRLLPEAVLTCNLCTGF